MTILRALDWYFAIFRGCAILSILSNSNLSNIHICSPRCFDTGLQCHHIYLVQQLYVYIIIEEEIFGLLYNLQYLIENISFSRHNYIEQLNLTVLRSRVLVNLSTNRKRLQLCLLTLLQFFNALHGFELTSINWNAGITLISSSVGLGG